jgi:hypothetical protein
MALKKISITPTQRYFIETNIPVFLFRNLHDGNYQECTSCHPYVSFFIKLTK